MTSGGFQYLVVDGSPPRLTRGLVVEHEMACNAAACSLECNALVKEFQKPYKNAYLVLAAVCGD